MSKKVFISRPTIISDLFEVGYCKFEQYIKHQGLNPQRLGNNNYTLDAPLKGVIDLMKKCDSAIILGYPQYTSSAMLAKADSPQSEIIFSVPTPWNQIEASLAFHEHLPLLIVAHKGIIGGVFDHGVTGSYILTADLSTDDWYKKTEFSGIFHEWLNHIFSVS
jgi:hypothetical protein